MPSKNDTRYALIGGRHRALSRYCMIVNRLKNTHRSKNAGYMGVQLLVSKDEFIGWFSARDFEGCSVDRIDPRGHYELSNMQVIPLGLNCAKDNLKAIDGMCECYVCKKSKTMEQFAVDKRRKQTGRSTICKACDNARHKNASPEARERKRVKSLAYYYRGKATKSVEQPKELPCTKSFSM